MAVHWSEAPSRGAVRMPILFFPLRLQTLIIRMESLAMSFLRQEWLELCANLAQNIRLTCFNLTRDELAQAVCNLKLLPLKLPLESLLLKGMEPAFTSKTA